MAPEAIRKGIRSLAANVRRLRVERELTQGELAEASGVDVRSVQQLERGTGNPTARVLLAVADGLGVTVGDLFQPARLRPRKVGRPRKAPREG